MTNYIAKELQDRINFYQYSLCKNKNPPKKLASILKFLEKKVLTVTTPSLIKDTKLSIKALETILKIETIA